MPKTHSSICVIGDLTCMGCCGRDYKPRKELEDGIYKNTLEFKKIKDRPTFIKRKDAEYLRSCGVCRNIIFTDETKTKVCCPVHPAFNEPGDTTDLREGHCEIEYLCKVSFLYDLWDKDKQKAFIKFIQKKNLDWYTFSIGMDNDSFVDEFDGNYIPKNK